MSTHANAAPMIGRVHVAVATALAAATLLVACGDDSGGDDGGAATDGLEIGGIATPGGPDAWPSPAPEDVSRLADAAGVPLERRETLIHHVHSHLDVFIDGEHRTVPAGIGIVITDPAVHTGEIAGSPAYGGIQGCDDPCISPLHTHDVTGIVHTESAFEEIRTLGELFQMWDVRLDDDCVGDHCAPDTSVRIFVDGDEVDLSRAADLPLTQGTEIAIVIGDPPDRIPDSADFSEG